MTLINGKTHRKVRVTKAQSDLETAHTMWTRRIQDIMVADGCSARAALETLRKEVHDPSYVKPQRRGQVTQAWASFMARIREASRS